MHCNGGGTGEILGSTPRYIVHQCIIQRFSPFLFLWIYQSCVDLGHYCFCELWDLRIALVERFTLQRVLFFPG